MREDSYKYVLQGDRGDWDTYEEGRRLDSQNNLDQYGLHNVLKSIDLDFIKSGDKIVDLGFGTGYFSLWLLDKIKNKSITINAVDFFEGLMDFGLSQLDENKRRVVNPIVDNFLTLKKVEDESQDVAITRCTYEHVPYEIDKFTSCIYKKLKPGGKLIIVDFDNISTNVQTNDESFNQQVIKVSYGIESFHPSICSRVYKELKNQNFNVLDIKNNLVTFLTPEEKKEESRVWEKRFSKLSHPLSRILGSDKEAENYIKSFHSAIEDPNSMLYMNMFAFIAEKPK